MSTPITDLAELIRSMQPTLHSGVYAFASVPPDTNVSALVPLGTFREDEGLTVIVSEETAQRAELPILFRSAWITLTVHSDLQAVGLTAAVATALAEADIPCNVVAGAYHDHLFVPVESSSTALAVLGALQQTKAS
jgi:hypothetical protein